MTLPKTFERVNPYDLNHVSKFDRYGGLNDRTRKPSRDPFITIPSKDNGRGSSYDRTEWPKK